jgi:hypothetical protein
MATDIFSTRPGYITAVESRGIPFGLLIDINNNWGGFEYFRSIATSIQLANQSNVQYLNTLRDFSYIYVFGERPGELNIGGISFFKDCGLQSNIINPNAHGIEYVLAYYAINRVSARATPIPVVLGVSIVVNCFLEGITVNMSDASSKVAEFSLKFRTMPYSVGSNLIRPI